MVRRPFVILPTTLLALFLFVPVPGLPAQATLDAKLQDILKNSYTRSLLEANAKAQVKVLVRYFYAVPGNTLPEDTLDAVFVRNFQIDTLMASVEADLKARFTSDDLDNVLKIWNDPRFRTISDAIHAAEISGAPASDPVQRPLEQFGRYDTQMGLANEYFSYSRVLIDQAYDFAQSLTDDQTRVDQLEKARHAALTDSSAPSVMLSRIRRAFERRFAGVSDDDFAYYMDRLETANETGFYKAYTKALYAAISHALIASVNDLEALVDQRQSGGTPPAEVDSPK
jgi:hypothetical protein